MDQHVVVIGAGIVGVSAGLWLRRAGARVTIVDRQAPGQGTSFGNAGVLASCAMVPVTVPGLIAKGPRYLLDRNFPLFMRWSYLPRLLPWLVRYLSNANDADTRRIAQGLMHVVGDSVEQHLAVARGGSAEKFVVTGDYVFAYDNRAAFDADSYVWGIRRDHGFAPELIENGAVREYDPAFGPAINCLAVMKNHGHIRNPGGYVAALADDFQAAGGVLKRAEVRDIRMGLDGAEAVVTDAGDIPCDRVVLATGVWSGPLMEKLGLKVPLEAERGYHLLLKDPSASPRNPSMIAAGKFVATPMEMGLRCAGVVEFGGLEAGPSQAPIALLKSKIAQTFPDLTWSEAVPWLGHRPAPSDSLPLIGEVEGTGVFTAFGHHHIGLTAGPKTGRMVAGLVAGQMPNNDMKPYDPARFRTG